MSWNEAFMGRLFGDFYWREWAVNRIYNHITFWVGYLVYSVISLWFFGILTTFRYVLDMFVICLDRKERVTVLINTCTNFVFQRNYSVALNESKRLPWLNIIFYLYSLNKNPKYFGTKNDQIKVIKKFPQIWIFNIWLFSKFEVTCWLWKFWKF